RAHSPHPLPRGERGRGEGEQSLTIILAGCAKKSKYLRLAIVGIGPWPGLEGMILEAERGFRIDAGAKINPVRLILGRCQHELPQRENPWVEIERPRLGPALGSRQLLLQLVGSQLDIRQLIRRDQVLENQETLTESRSHGRLIITGLIERKVRAGPRDGAKENRQPFPGPTQSFLMPAKCRDDQEIRRGQVRLAHEKVRIKDQGSDRR